MFDLPALRAAVAAHGRVARLVITGVDGSGPRETGAAMLVWAGGQEGTIGGGALEWAATARARALLASGPAGAARHDREALGPGLGQCCGGMVGVLAEIHDAATVAALEGRAVIARPLVPGGQMPLAVGRALAQARREGRLPAPQLLQGWMIEPLAVQRRAVWVWGAGHVGRALVGVMRPLPEFHLTWIDTARARFPDTIPDGVDALWTATPARLIAHAPADAAHLILTYSHALDLELCHGLLTHGFGWAGLIGSATKWKRFRQRLGRLGHGAGRIDAITCPIGDRALGKHPQAIALGVAVQLLKNERRSGTEIADDDRGDSRAASAAGGADQDLSGGHRQ